jgi:hypothetical protein
MTEAVTLHRKRCVEWKWGLGRLALPLGAAVTRWLGIGYPMTRWPLAQDSFETERAQWEQETCMPYE